MQLVYLQYLFSVIAFIGSYLLFAVQPMVGKLFLPAYGGVSSVWTTIMLFFSGTLLLGYGYVSILKRFHFKVQRIIHTVLLIASTGVVVRTMAVTHGSFFEIFLTPGGNVPVVSLLSPLVTSIALPCVILATTSILLQHWYAKFFPDRSPYFLYSISNAGSLLGLLSYPFIIEPRFTLGVQQQFWNWGWMIYVALMGGVIALTSRSVESDSDHHTAYIFTKPVFGWLFLPFVGTLAMLAFTSQLTSIISAVPFLWVATLGVYLLSFIVAFIEGDWYPRIFYATVLVGCIGTIAAVTSGFIDLKYQFLLPLALIGLFIIDVVCHRELFRQKPHPKFLTTYYFVIALGGLLASVFAGVVAPLLFNDYLEYPVVLFLAGLLGIGMFMNQTSRPVRFHGVAYGCIMLFIVAGVYRYSGVFEQSFYTITARVRNFYGVNKILERASGTGRTVRLVNGHTLHGLQEIGGSTEGDPTTYYTRDSGLGYAIGNHPTYQLRQPMRIGVVGLGAGTIAAYCRSNDYFRFYEINPQIIDISTRYFTYISNAKKAGCTVDITQGDARVSLQHEYAAKATGQFDVLVVDAFTDDMIPVHLLTKEAVNLYFSHIRDGGIVAFNTSNKNLTIAAVLSADIRGENIYTSYFETANATWLLMTKTPVAGINWAIPKTNKDIQPWTDQYSNIYGILVH